MPAPVRELVLVRVVQPTEEQSVISHPEFGGRHDDKFSHSYFFHSLCKHVRLLRAVTKRINLPGNTGTAALSKIIIKKSAKQEKFNEIKVTLHCIGIVLL